MAPVKKQAEPQTVMKGVVKKQVYPVTRTILKAVPFKHSFTGVCAGPTGCGKTELMKDIILNYKYMIRPAPHRVIWYFAERQLQLEKALRPIGVEFHQGMPELEEFDGSQPVLLVVDDFMSECNSAITKLFTKGSHHRNLSIWFLLQNFFHRGKEIRDITLNAHYLILFKNPRDCQQIKVLAQQMYDREYRFVLDAYKDATKRPHGYLLLDVKQDTPDCARVRSNILPGQKLWVYVPRKAYKSCKILTFTI